jgi:hypothetical protein
MNTLEDVIELYKIDYDGKHRIIYDCFKNNAVNYENGLLRTHYEKTDGFGELAFYWNWLLLVKSMPDHFKFLEIGVYKGRVLSVIQLLSNIFNKSAQIYGVTPLENLGDKYSNYDKADYLACIQKSFTALDLTFENTTIINGLSQHGHIVAEAREQAEYDIVFIDGCHDYEIVCLDIKNYSPMLKVGGYLVLDDASSLLKGAYGQFLGHQDVARAIQSVLDNDDRYAHVYAVGHNRMWKKMRE